MLRLETLKSLMIGDDVREVQKALVAHGIDIKVDGTYGPFTEAQVRQFLQPAGLQSACILLPCRRLLGGSATPEPSDPGVEC